MSTDHSTQPIAVRRDGAVWICTLSNPPRHTLTAAGVLALHGLVDEMESGDPPRVLVLTGGGEGVFVAHYEVGELAAGAEANVRQAEQSRPPATDIPAEEGVELHAFHQLILRLEASPVITVAALNGNAAGGGPRGGAALLRAHHALSRRRRRDAGHARGAGLGVEGRVSRRLG